MIMKRIGTFLLVFLLFSALFPACLADQKDYSPYITEVMVKAGDTVSNICDSNHLDYYAVKEAVLIINGYSSEEELSAVHPGQKLYLPKSKSAADSILALYHSTVSTEIPESYVIRVTVQKGDTLMGICDKNGLTFNACKDAIKILNLWSGDFRLSTIAVGQELLLPSSDAAAAAITALIASQTVSVTPNPSPAVAAAATPIPNQIADSAFAFTTPSPIFQPVINDPLEYYLTPYTVGTGETIQSICSRLGIRYSAEVAGMLKAINNTADLDNLDAGITLLLPSRSDANAVYAVYSHTVTSGETIDSLCSAYGVRYEQVSAMLRGLNPNIPLTILSAGSQLLLIAPCATAAVPVPSPSPSVTISVK